MMSEPRRARLIGYAKSNMIIIVSCLLSVFVIQPLYHGMERVTVYLMTSSAITNMNVSHANSM